MTLAHPERSKSALAPHRILAVAPVSGYEGHNTSAHRIAALRSLGHRVAVIDSTVSHFPWTERIRAGLFRSGLAVPQRDIAAVNQRLINAATEEQWDILWLEKAMTVDAQNLCRFKHLSPQTVIVGYSPDDMYARHNQSKQFLEAISHYDFFVTTKSYNVSELQALGCPQGIFVGNAYDPEVFRPLPVSPEDRERLGGDIGFIGSYEADRADSLVRLCRAGFSVRVWGGNWKRLGEHPATLRVERKPLVGDDYARACAAFKINLCFLRKINRDRQTTRSVELPACGAFMLAERTEEHLELFEEGVEAEFFSSDAELIHKCSKYLSLDVARQAIAAAGLARCKASGYDNKSRMDAVLQQIEGLHRGWGV